jgi:hypothetical protein
VKSLQVLRQILLVARHRLAIHSWRGASLEAAKRSLQSSDSEVMQQCGESCARVPHFYFADPRELSWQRVPALRPDSGDLAQFSFRPAG